MSVIRTKRIETVVVDTVAARKVLGAMIRNGRKKLGISQDQLASLVMISRAQIANLESGRAWVSMEQFVKLIHALDLKFSRRTFA